MSFTVRLITDGHVYEHRDVVSVSELPETHSVTVLDVIGASITYPSVMIKHIDVFWNKEA